MPRDPRRRLTYRLTTLPTFSAGVMLEVGPGRLVGRHTTLLPTINLGEEEALRDEPKQTKVGNAR